MKYNIKKHIRFAALAMLAVITYSCEKEVDVDLRSVPPRVFIEGYIAEDSLATVRVGHTVDFSNKGEYPMLKGATVRVWDNDGNEETLLQDAKGWYTAKTLKGKIGRTYNLSVIYDNKEYTAISKMPPHVGIDSLTMYKIPMMDYAFPMAHYTDPVGKATTYYRHIVYINGEQVPDMFEIVTTTEYMDGAPYHRILPVHTENDDKAKDLIKQGDELLVEQQCIDKGAYLFFESLSRMDNSLTNPTTNIKGGALGYFSAYSLDKKTIIAKWEEK